MRRERHAGQQLGIVADAAALGRVSPSLVEHELAHAVALEVQRAGRDELICPDGTPDGTGPIRWPAPRSWIPPSRTASPNRGRGCRPRPAARSSPRARCDRSPRRRRLRSPPYPRSRRELSCPCCRVVPSELWASLAVPEAPAKSWWRCSQDHALICYSIGAGEPMSSDNCRLMVRAAGEEPRSKRSEIR